MDIGKLKYMFSKAEEDKNNIKTIYNSVLELTDTFATIKDEGKVELGAQRDVDSDVLSAIDTLVSYIMSSILTKGAQWADLEVDEMRVKDMFGENAQKVIEEVNSVLSKDVNRCFKFIQNSNYYEEISKAMMSFVKLGTGCYAIRETGNTGNPFTFEYVGLDNLYIMNDTFSRPNTVFKKHPEVNGEYLLDMFGEDIILPDGLSDSDYKATSDVFECVIPEYDENTTLTKYNYIVCDKSMTRKLLEKELAYNPFVVFRWSTEEGTAWGTSIVLKQKNLLEEMNEYKTIFKKQAVNIANPPKGFIGNMELFNSISMDDGALNYFGDPSTGMVPPSIQTIGGNSSLMPLDKLINECLVRFKGALMVSHLTMNVQDTKYNTAEAIQTLHEMFRQRFANTYELINSELIQPTFMSPFIIMLKSKSLSLTEDIVPYIGIKYVSELTKADNMSKVNKIVSYMDVAYKVQELNKGGVMINLSKALPEIQELMGINPELVPSESEILEYQEAQRQQLLQQQMMNQGVMEGDMNGGQEV